MLPLKKNISAHVHMIVSTIRASNKESILAIKKQIKETRVTIGKKTKTKEKLQENLKKSFKKRLWKRKTKKATEIFMINIYD